MSAPIHSSQRSPVARLSREGENSCPKNSLQALRNISSCSEIHRRSCSLCLSCSSPLLFFRISSICCQSASSSQFSSNHLSKSRLPISGIVSGPAVSSSFRSLSSSPSFPVSSSFSVSFSASDGDASSRSSWFLPVSASPLSGSSFCFICSSAASEGEAVKNTSPPPASSLFSISAETSFLFSSACAGTVIPAAMAAVSIQASPLFANHRFLNLSFLLFSLFCVLPAACSFLPFFLLILRHDKCRPHPERRRHIQLLISGSSLRLHPLRVNIPPFQIHPIDEARVRIFFIPHRASEPVSFRKG